MSYTVTVHDYDDDSDHYYGCQYFQQLFEALAFAHSEKDHMPYMSVRVYGLSDEELLYL